jgi:hypothetical protein
MGRRRWRPAALLAVGLVSVALFVGRAAPSIPAAHEAVQHAGHDTRDDGRSAVADAAAIPVAPVGSLLVLRRIAPDSGTKSFLADLAAVTAACALALAGRRRALQWGARARTAVLVALPCGVRAPPTARA